ncbi:MAG: nicotinate-nucleotide adenylyltransferase [Armatimonadota bacterium]
MLRLGIMGGTFDPPHMAHLIMAEQAVAEFRLGTALFIPAGNPPHKDCMSVTDAEHRYAMTLLATADNPFFQVSRIEVDRTGPSYSVDTIRQIRGIYGADTEIYFIIGADEALNIASWHQAESLPDIVKFIVAPRPCFDLVSLEERLPPKFHSVLHILSMQPVYLSSTDLRTRVINGESIRYLVPDEVNIYIAKHRLYSKGNDE